LQTGPFCDYIGSDGKTDAQGKKNTVKPKIVAALLLTCMLAAPLSAQVIKMGSLAPEGSPWDKALKRIASDWSVLSGGKIRVKIFPGGIAGDEPDMVRKMRINQLQAAAITGIGLGSITESIYAVQLPLLIRTDAEFDYVIAEMGPALNGLLEEKGFTMLAWFLAGWAHFFTKTPMVTPAEMKKLKMQVDDSAPTINQAWKEMGFHIVPVPSTQVLPALQSGMIEAFTLTPLTAAATQWFGPAKHMADLRIAPMFGGILVSQRAWNRIDPGLKPELIAAVNRHLDTLRRETLALEAEAMRVMLDNGLIIHSVPPDAAAQWERVVAEGLDIIVGSAVPAQLVAEVRGHLEDFRSAAPPPAAPAPGQ
jgi:TRAP-type C4-dicarboxylate transport system substrate-binding protein